MPMIIVNECLCHQCFAKGVDSSIIGVGRSESSDNSQRTFIFHKALEIKRSKTSNKEKTVKPYLSVIFLCTK